MGVIPFRGHVTHLCSRAGKTGWAMRVLPFAILTFPHWLRSRVMISKSEDTFWDEVAACVNTEMADRLRDKRDDHDRDRRNGKDSGRDTRSNSQDSRNGQDSHNGQYSRNSNSSRRSNDKSKKCLFCGSP